MLILLYENKELKDRRFSLPPGIKTNMSKLLNDYNGPKNISGYKRLKNLVSMSSLSYQEMKRLKNFFDTYSGNKTDDTYLLNGGDDMKLWVYNTLKNSRQIVYDYKKAKQEIGIRNSFIKPHEKNK